LLAPYIERRVAELAIGTSISVALERGGAGDRRERSDAAMRSASRSGGIITRRPDGRPEVNGSAVSAAHAGELTLAVAGAGAAACDLEPVAPREASVWRELLGVERARLADQIAREIGEEYDAAATRVWAAAECLKKAGVQPAAPLALRVTTPDGWAMLVCGSLQVATMIAEVRDVEGRLALAILGETRSRTCETTNTSTPSASKTPTSSATSTT
jgi:enediyne polyketide synthase